MAAKPRSTPGTVQSIADPLLELIERTVDSVRRNPGAFPDTRTIAESAGISLPHLESLCLLHYHATVEDLLLRARLAVAKTLLLEGGETARAIASRVGFSSTPTFKEGFRGHNGMGPDAWRELSQATSFELTLPKDYPLAYLRRALSRDAHSVTERLQGDTYITAHPFADGPLVVEMRLAPKKICVRVSRGTTQMNRVHAMTVGILGLDQNTTAWIGLAHHHGMERLVAACPGLRIHQTPTIYDGLLWTVIGQQINMAFAFTLKRRLMVLAGVPVESGLHASPTPAAVAAFEPSDLLPLQYSRQKADYIISISRRIAEGKLDLEALRWMSATRTEHTLLAVRGLGKWSVNYLMMRSLGFADCLPLGDTGVTSSLWSLFGTERRPGPEETLALMKPFSPFRSLATAHLWQWRLEEPS